MGKLCVIGLGGQTAFLRTATLPYPGETVQCSSLFYELGGKGYNQAIAAARMGIDTLFVGAVGKDSYASACREELEGEGIETYLVEKDLPTAFAVVTRDNSGENTVEVYPGAARELREEDLLSDIALQKIKNCDCILIQNEVTVDCNKALLNIAEEYDIPVIFNPAPANAEIKSLLTQCSLITPNLEEAKLILDIPREETVTDEEFAQKFRKIGMAKVVITDGAKGVLLIENGIATRMPAFSAGKVTDTTGAGDVFSGVLAGCLLSGKDLRTSAKTAAVAAGIAVTRNGAAPSAPKKEEVFSCLKDMKNK